MHLPPIVLPLHAEANPRHRVTYFPKGHDLANGPLKRLHDAFEPAPHPGTRRVQEALHEAVQHAEAGALRFAMRCAWWWVRRKLHKML